MASRFSKQFAVWLVIKQNSERITSVANACNLLPSGIKCNHGLDPNSIKSADSNKV